MDFSKENLISVNEILADVLMTLDDEGMKTFSKGFLTSQIQKALAELSFDTFFLDLYKDIKFPTDTLTLALPKGAFNLKQVFLFNGDECTVSNSTNVWIKNDYITKGAGKGYTARNIEGATGDPFIKGYKSDNYKRERTPSEGLYYCSEQNGNIMFSSSCASFDMVRLEYNGVQTSIGEVPFIPMQFREAVALWVETRCFKILAARKPRFYRTMYKDSYQELMTPFSGVWAIAETRAKTMSSKESQDLKEYLSKMNY